MKQILYIDCDGVILDTVRTAIKLSREYKQDVNFLFRNIDWNILIYESGILNDSINKIKKIVESSIYDVKILTKLCGNDTEEMAKRILLGKLLPNVEIITLKYEENKDDVVNPYNNILIDDEEKNYIRWINKGGIGIHFVLENPDITKNEISDISEINKVLIKSINF